MKRVQIKFTDPASGLDAACAPIERIAALLAALQKTLPELPGTVPERDVLRVLQIVGGLGTQAAAPAPDAEKDVAHVPFRGEKGEVILMYDLHGERARAHAKRMGCTVDLPDGSSQDFV